MKSIAAIVSVIAILALACTKPGSSASKLSSDDVSDKQDNKNLALPPGAVIIEEESLGSSKSHPDRALILWIVNPTKHPSEAQGNPKYDYTCIDETTGSYYGEPASVSLINTKTRTVINTIKIESREEGYHIPYAIRKGLFYRVEGNAPESEEVKPHIMWLKDYNGDGKALEFALFSKDDCSLVDTALIGYSEQQDRVMQYPIEIVTDGSYGRSTYRSGWLPSLFVRKPTSPGHWKYERDDRPHAGSLDKYEIRYDAQKEIFVGKCVQISGETK